MGSLEARAVNAEPPPELDVSSASFMPFLLSCHFLKAPIILVIYGYSSSYRE